MATTENGQRDEAAGRIWFWKPQRHWFGWQTLIPFLYGHDEYARRVLCFGWTFTGRVLVAVWGCGDLECEAEASELRLQEMEAEVGA